MDEDIIKRRQRELSKQQAIYVANRAKGLSRQKSAIMAGYADVDKAGEQVEESARVQEELARARAETAEAVGTTKEDIAQMMKDAIEMARVMSDPQAMVRGAAELGKLLGLYSPEVKKVQHELGQKTVDALRALPDSELMKLAHGRVIDSTAVEVKE